MTPIIIDTEFLHRLSITDDAPIWTKLRRYFIDRKFEVPYTPARGMTVSLYSFLDDSFTEWEKDDISRYDFVVEDVYMTLGHLLIFVQGMRLLPGPDVLNPKDN